MTKKFIAFSMVILSWFFLWPLAILYWLSNQKKTIYQDIMADMKFRSPDLRDTSAVLYVLLLDKYHRTLFYYRIGGSSLLVSWLWKADNSFNISSKQIMGGGILCAPILNLPQCTIYRS